MVQVTNTFTVLPEHLGKTIRAKLTATNSAGTASAESADTATVVDPVIIDTTPSPFGFTSALGQNPNATVTSNSVVPIGYNAAAAVSVVGGLVSINGGPFTTTPGNISPGQTIQARGTASSAFATDQNVDVTIGGVTGRFTITTMAQDIVPDAFQFLAKLAQPLSTVVDSDSVTPTGYNAPSPVSVTGGLVSVNGGAFTASPGNIAPSQTIQARGTSSTLGGTTTNVVVTIGGVSGTFQITTASTTSLKARRYFRDACLWNTPIPANPTLHVNSAAYANTIKNNLQHTIQLNRGRFCPNMVFAPATTPRQWVRPPFNQNVGDGDFFWALEGVPVTGPEATGSDDSDGHLIIIDEERGYAYNMGGPARYQPNGTIDAPWLGIYHLDGDGWWDPDQNKIFGYAWGWTGRSSNASLLGGVITIEQFQKGEIEHALAIGMDPSTVTALGGQIYPAKTADPTNSGSVPMGARLQLNPAFDPTPFSPGREALLLINALKKYGAFIVEASGGFAFYLQCFGNLGTNPYAAMSFAGMEGGDTPLNRAIHANWRVIAAPPAGSVIYEDATKFTPNTPVRKYLSAADSTVSSFTIPAKTGASASTQYESDPVTPIGYNRPVTFSVTGGQLLRNDDNGWVASGTIYPGDFIKLRGTSPATVGQTTNVTVTMGGASATFAITTGVSGPPPPPPPGGAPVNSTAPVLTALSNTPAGFTAQTGRQLTVGNGVWTNSPTSYAYQWQRDVAGNGTYSNISGATTANYIPLHADANCNVRCQITASNGAGAGNAASSNALRVAGQYLQNPSFDTAGGAGWTAINGAVPNWATLGQVSLTGDLGEGIKQQVANLVPGKTYTVTVDLAVATPPKQWAIYVYEPSTPSTLLNNGGSGTYPGTVGSHPSSFVAPAGGVVVIDFENNLQPANSATITQISLPSVA